MLEKDSSSEPAVPAPMSAGRQLAHRITLLAVKAGFSCLPLAVFAFDVMEKVVDFGNAHLVDRWLDQVGKRIEQLEEGERERVKVDQIYQLSGRAALQRMLGESNPRMADALARAVAELGASDLSDPARMEIARALDVLTEPSLHLLQTIYRAQNGMLTKTELDLVEGDVTRPYHFTLLAYTSMNVTSWIAPMSDLQRAGMVQTLNDAGWFGEVVEAVKADEGHTVAMPLVYKTGERVVTMCFDDPSKPAFGIYAVETTEPLS